MWNLEVGRVDDLIPGQDQIEIQRSRRAGIGPDTAGLLLDRPQAIEDLPHRQIRLPHPDGIQVSRVVFQTRTYRRRVDERRQLEVSKEEGERVSSCANVTVPGPQVRPESNRYRTHC